MIHTVNMFAQASEVSQVDAVSALSSSTLLILAVVVIVVILVAVLVSKNRKALPSETESSTNKKRKKLSHKPKTSKGGEDGEKSLAAIKAEKRETTGDLTKEEKRALREERRAKNQTEKSKQERAQEETELKPDVGVNLTSEEKEAPKPESLDVSETPKVLEDVQALETEVAASFAAVDEVAPEATSPSMAIRLNELFTESNLTSEDLFTSLFGNSSESNSSCSIDDELTKMDKAGEPKEEENVIDFSLGDFASEPAKESDSSATSDGVATDNVFDQIFLGRVGSTATSLKELERLASEGDLAEVESKSKEEKQKEFQAAAELSVRKVLEENARAEQRVADLAKEKELIKSEIDNETTISSDQTSEISEDKTKLSKSAQRRKRKKNKQAREQSDAEQMTTSESNTEQGASVSEDKKEKSHEAEVIPKQLQSSDKKVGTSHPKSLGEGLKETRSKGFIAQIHKIFKSGLKDNVVEELEDILYTADIGVKTSDMLLEKVTQGLADKGDTDAAIEILRSEILGILQKCERPFELGNEKPHIILTIGVNGAGKTTTLGKLAAQMNAQGKRVLLVAGDTFRAAAIEQLQEWSERAGCSIHYAKQGADPSATIYDGIKRAQAEGFDVVLADTAGRLHNKKDLVDELQKIFRVCGKAEKGAPHQCILVLDATNGQNALAQAREFGEAISFSGIILTKLDGTAKGGVIIGICDEFKKPVYFIGIGELVHDLRKFSANEFLEALFMDI